jgi:hypothetical protein
MSPSVRTPVAALLLIAWLARIAVAGPPAAADPDPADHDPNDAATPWLDLAPARVLTEPAEPGPTNHKLAAALTLGGIYAGFSTWTYFAWYRHHKPLDQYLWGYGDDADGNANIFSARGWLGARQYSGGADKFGHAWATYGLARGGTELLAQWGGFDRVGSSLVSAGLSELLFLSVEIKDGFYYEFSFGDFTFNTLGALLSIAMSNWPRLDELIDYRVEYFPSAAYRRQISHSKPSDCLAGDPRRECEFHSNLNIAEDYSGETYLLALHLGGIHSLRDSKYGAWTRFVDVALGFDARGYKPEPPPGYAKYKESQHLFIGVSLNAQGVFDWLLDGRSRSAKKILHGTFEMFNAPFGSLPVIERVNHPSSVKTGGA